MKEFLFGFPANPQSMVFLRGATAFLSALSLLAIWPDFQAFYGPNALVDLELLQVWHGSPTISVQKGMAFLHQQVGLTAGISRLSIAILYLGLCTSLAIGLFTRISAFMLLILHGSLFTAIPQFSYGADYFCSVALFYCTLFPVGHYKSIDRTLFHLSPSPWLSPCLRILQVHLCLVYFFSGFEKALGTTWHNGEAIWKTLHLPYFRSSFPIDFNNLAPYPWLFVGMGIGVLLIELLYPVFIWWKPTRKILLSLVIALHIGIALMLSLYLFSAMMIALNLAAFYFKPRLEAESSSIQPRPSRKTSSYKPLTTP